MITLLKREGQKVLELGGGDNPNPASDCNVDVRQGEKVHFVVDFETPNWPIADEDFHVVFSQYCLEHVSWRCVRQFLAEVMRILKPGGKAVFVVPNTEAQLQWIQKNPGGWDGKGIFESASCVLYGDQDYPANTHKSYFSSVILHDLFQKAGFERVITRPFGERATDMVVEASKPVGEPIISRFQDGVLEQVPQSQADKEYAERSRDRLAKQREASKPVGEFTSESAAKMIVAVERHEEKQKAKLVPGNEPFPAGEVKIVNEREQPKSPPELKAEDFYIKQMRESHGVILRSGGDIKVLDGEGNDKSIKSPTEQLMQTTEGRQEVFNKDYFNGGHKHGGYAREGMWDFPVHEITARHILHRKPESVLEIGCARGYILKRLQDAGIAAVGLEISKHCYMTRVADQVFQKDLCDPTWFDGWLPYPNFDLCFSIATLEHVPEEHVPAVIKEMVRTCKRGLHGIDFGERDDGFDKTHCTLRSKVWWEEQFKKHAPGWPVEILDKEELEAGVFKWSDGSLKGLPEDYVVGDGKLKLAIGTYTVMSHHGWVNIDVHDLGAFAQHHGYVYKRNDVRNGLPYGTGVVDLLHCSHMLEHLSPKEALTFLRECRRVIRPGGAMRIAVPNAEWLMNMYTSDLGELSQFDEINEGCAAAPTAAGKLWALLHEGHQNIFDAETLSHLLQEAGFEPLPVTFRETKSGDVGKQLLRETLDMFCSLSLFMEARPKLS